MPPKRFVEVSLFSPDSVSRSHCKKKTPSCSNVTSRATVDCFPSSSNSFSSINPPSPESPVRVPRYLFLGRGRAFLQ